MTPTLPPGQLKAFDPSTDVGAVIKLIEESFNLQNDSESLMAIEQMRRSAERQEQFGVLPGDAYQQPGYVWKIDGAIVGNINIISFLDNLRHIALIANVAVKPEFQHLGIAKALTKQALRYCEQKRASEVWLQVSEENVAAHKLYLGLGFEIIRPVNNWLIEKKPASFLPSTNSMPSETKIGSRMFWDYPKQKIWLEETYPVNTRWYASVDFAQFPPLSWLNPLTWDSGSNLSHFVLRKQSELLGVLSWQRGLQKTDYLWLAIPENEKEGEVIAALMGHFLQNEWEGKTLRLEYPGGRAEKSLAKAGFKLNRRLQWMKQKR